MIEFEAHDDPPLADAGEEIRTIRFDLPQTVGDVGRNVMNLGARLRARADFEDFGRRDAAKLRSPKRGHVAEAILLEPLAGLLVHHHRGDRIDPTRQTLSGHQNVGDDAIGVDAPHLSRAHQAGLHFVGDVESADLFAGRLDRLQIAGLRHWKAVGRRDRLHDHAGRIPDRDCREHPLEIVERHLDHLIARGIREEELREAVVADLDCKSGMSVIAALDADEFPPLGRMPGALERDIDRLPAARREDRVLQAFRGQFRQHFGDMRAHERGEMVIADIEILHALTHRFDDFRVAVTEAVGAAIEMDIDQPPSIHVPEKIAFAAIDDEIDPHALPLGRLAGVPELFRAGDEFIFFVAHGQLPTGFRDLDPSGGIRLPS